MLRLTISNFHYLAPATSSDLSLRNAKAIGVEVVQITGISSSGEDIYGSISRDGLKHWRGCPFASLPILLVCCSRGGTILFLLLNEVWLLLISS
jgi:hypothetical protein